LNINVKILREGAIVPTYGSAGAAAADLYACLDAPVTLAPNETQLIGTGFTAAIPSGYVGLVFARSGLATKRGLAPANKVGVVDSDYRGEYLVPLRNHSDEPQTITHGERIAQMAIIPVSQALFTVVDNLDATERGDGGFGSTGL